MKIKMDPLKKFTDVPVDRMVEAVGILPLFAKAAYDKHPEEPTARAVFDTMMAEYGFGFGDGSMEASITHGGIWVSEHEEDEPLYPLVKVFWKDVQVYLYQHALVAIVSPTEQLLTRMD